MANTLLKPASRAGFARWKTWVTGRVEKVRYGFAVLVGAMGIAVLTGADKWVEARALDWLPEAWTALTIGI